MWEYRVVADSFTFQTAEQVQAETAQSVQRLNAEGSQGWELVAVQSVTTGQQRVALIYFYKRPRKTG